MKIIKKIIFILSIILIGVGIGNYLTVKKTQRNTSIEYVNSMLYNLNIELDLLEHWESKYKSDLILEEKLKHLILNKMMAMSLINPNINDLQGVPIEALYRLSKINKNSNIAIEKHDAAFKIALDYLSSIENEVGNILKKRKNVHKRLLK